jgi:hypothetical protein
VTLTFNWYSTRVSTAPLVALTCCSAVNRPSRSYSNRLLRPIAAPSRSAAGGPHHSSAKALACCVPMNGADRAGPSKWNSCSTGPEGRPGQLENGYVRLPLMPNGHRCPPPSPHL